MRSINSYVPEWVRNERIGNDLRNCLEDCAVLTVRDGDWIMLAGRFAEKNGKGSGFADLFSLPASEIAFLQSRLPFDARILLRGGERAVLIFADVYPLTGLLLAVSPFADAEDVRTALAKGGNHFAVSPAYAEKIRPVTVETENAFRILSEELFYVERLLSGMPEGGLWLQIRQFARYAGCRVEEREIPVGDWDLSITDAEKTRLRLFLFAAFLRLRTEDVEVTAELTAAGMLRLRLHALSDRPQEKEKDAIRLRLRELIAVPAFSEFDLSEEANALLISGHSSADRGLILRADTRMRQIPLFRLEWEAGTV